MSFFFVIGHFTHNLQFSLRSTDTRNETRGKLSQSSHLNVVFGGLKVYTGHTVLQFQATLITYKLVSYLVYRYIGIGI